MASPMVTIDWTITIGNMLEAATICIAGFLALTRMVGGQNLVRTDVMRLEKRLDAVDLELKAEDGDPGHARQTKRQARQPRGAGGGAAQALRLTFEKSIASGAPLGFGRAGRFFCCLGIECVPSKATVFKATGRGSERVRALSDRARSAESNSTWAEIRSPRPELVTCLLAVPPEDLPAIAVDQAEADGTWRPA
jgi:hypothetical protein